MRSNWFQETDLSFEILRLLFCSLVQFGGISSPTVRLVTSIPLKGKTIAQGRLTQMCQNCKQGWRDWQGVKCVREHNNDNNENDFGMWREWWVTELLSFTAQGFITLCLICLLCLMGLQRLSRHEKWCLVTSTNHGSSYCVCLSIG